MLERMQRMGRHATIALATMLAGTIATLAPAIAAAEVLQPTWNVNIAKPPASHVPVLSWGQLQFEIAGTKVTCQDMLNGSVWNENGRGVGRIEGFAAGACRGALEGPPYCEVVPPEGCPRLFVTAELPLEKQLVEGETCREEAKTKLSECPSALEREATTLIRRPLRRRPTSLPWVVGLARGIREEEEVVLAEVGAAGASCYPTERVIVEGKETQRPASWEKVPAGCIKLTVLAPSVALEVVVYGALTPQLVNGFGSGLNPSHLAFNAAAGKLVQSEEASGSTTEGVITGNAKLIGQEGRELITAK